MVKFRPIILLFVFSVLFTFIMFFSFSCLLYICLNVFITYLIDMFFQFSFIFMVPLQIIIDIPKLSLPAQIQNYATSGKIQKPCNCVDTIELSWPVCHSCQNYTWKFICIVYKCMYITTRKYYHFYFQNYLLKNLFRRNFKMVEE